MEGVEEADGSDGTASDSDSGDGSVDTDDEPLISRA
jgi:hypothetical protein